MRKRKTSFDMHGASVIPGAVINYHRSSDFPCFGIAPHAMRSEPWKYATPMPAFPVPGDSLTLQHAPVMDITAIQEKAEHLELQTRISNEEVQREAEQQCRQMFDTKGVRVTHACEHCRQRKAKCTGQQPCTRCTRQGRLCLFSKVEKKRKVTSSLEDFTTNAFSGSGSAWTSEAVVQTFRPQIGIDTSFVRGAGARYASLPAALTPMGHRAVASHPSTPTFGLPDPSIMEHSGSLLVGRYPPGGMTNSVSLPVSPLAPPMHGQHGFDEPSAAPGTHAGEGHRGAALLGTRNQNRAANGTRARAMPDYRSQLDVRGPLGLGSGGLFAWSGAEVHARTSSPHDAPMSHGDLFPNSTSEASRPGSAICSSIDVAPSTALGGSSSWHAHTEAPSASGSSSPLSTVFQDAAGRS
ncbi:hypothetical protein ACQY0O_001053 [Thecaphora frezii]